MHTPMVNIFVVSPRIPLLYDTRCSIDIIVYKLWDIKKSKHCLRILPPLEKELMCSQLCEGQVRQNYGLVTVFIWTLCIKV